MTSATHGRRSPSESQSRALYDRESPYREVRWSSEAARARRRAEPPKGVDAKVAWLRYEWEAEIPQALHERGTDDSELGAPPFSGAFRNRLGSPHSKDEDGNLFKPMQSSLEWLRHHRRHAWDTIVALIYQGKWEWRQLANVPFYRVVNPQTGERALVRLMDVDVLELVLDSGLDALWREFTYSREAVGGGAT